MKIWKDEYRNWEARKFDGIRYHPCNTANQPEYVLFVRVCSFTFVFTSVEEIQEYLDYYSKKIHPSSAGWAGNKWRPLNVGDHWDRQTTFDRLPLYLREEPKRQKVVKALQAALAQFSK